MLPLAIAATSLGRQSDKGAPWAAHVDCAIS